MGTMGCGLFCGRLQQAGLQGQQFLRVLDRQGGLGGLCCFAHGGLGHLQVQFDELFDAFESLVGQAKEGFDRGFVGSSSN